MFFKSKGRDVGQVAKTIDDREANVGIVFSNRLNDRSLGKSDPDNQIVVAFRERAHRGFDGGWIPGFDIAQHNRQCGFAAIATVWPGAGFSTLRARPGRGVERTIVFTANIENNPYANL